MRSFSGKGTPPRSSARAGSRTSTAALVARLAEIGQHARLDHVVAHAHVPLEDDQRVLVVRTKGEHRTGARSAELHPDMLGVAPGGGLSPP